MKNSKCLITGGAGFVGVNLASRLIREGHEVHILDNLSRAGVEKNLQWLKQEYPGSFEFIKADVRSEDKVREAVEEMDAIFHFASQVAVTTSVEDPRSDFEINALGTLNVLDAARKCNPGAIVFFTSTNKVYGKLASLETEEAGERYQFRNLKLGVNESQHLDFYSPYGCSKGTGDQYMLDYARIFGMRTVVFRMSCIYGPHQYGNEDQGWVAHFVKAALKNHKLNIFGNGKQVRDILFVEDLVDAFISAGLNIDETAGKAFNIGGGLENSISLIELLKILENLTGSPVKTDFYDWRPGDQKIYISDITKASETFNWRPRISKEEGIKRLYNWIRVN